MQITYHNILKMNIRLSKYESTSATCAIANTQYSSSFRQIKYNRQPPSLDWRAVSSGCDILQPVRTVMSLIVSTVWCCWCIVFVASRVFAFLQRTLLLLFSLSGSRDICIGVHSMSACVCGRAEVIRALFPVLVKYYCQFVFVLSIIISNSQYCVHLFVDLISIIIPLWKRDFPLKGKGSFYIAQYPVRRTAQSALHFLPSLTDLFVPTPFSASPGSILAMQQLRATTKSLICPPLSIARYSFIQLNRQGRQWRAGKCPIFQTVAKGDSNPGSLDCDSGILPLSYRAPHNASSIVYSPRIRSHWRGLLYVHDVYYTVWVDYVCSQ